MAALDELPAPPFEPMPTVATLTGSADPTQSAASWTTHNGPDATQTLDNTTNRFLAVLNNGSDAERVLRGFLFGVVVGMAVAVFSCCWLPCFRRSRRLERQQLGVEARSRRRWLEGRQEGRTEERGNG